MPYDVDDRHIDAQDVEAVCDDLSGGFRVWTPDRGAYLNAGDSHQDTLG
ncbi:MAG: hypothetical protein JWR37_6201 [Mycobacterium sp.]|jgi:hypothetical protein|nr:hypothetical protein [Mycobacterium sp.]